MINLCTFTGVDVRTDLGRVIEMASAYPFLEFGILLSRTPEDKDPRYPQFRQIADMVERLCGRAKLALHVCGRAVGEFVREPPKGSAYAGQDIHDLIAAGIGRVQLNFNFERFGLSLEEIEAAVQRTDAKVITQHFPANTAVTFGITAPNHQVLYDASGGRGVAATGYDMPFAGKYTGYAGGLGPDNAAAAVAAIKSIIGDDDVWIDMESRIRTDGYLDLDKCGGVAAVIAPILTASAASS
jgi:phosphoribosylanthranilate isomerase